MSTSVEINNIRKVLFFADGARGQMAALRRAAGIAIHNGADLTVIGVVNEVSTNDVRLRRNMQSIQKTLTRDRGLELDQLIADIGPLKGRKLSVRRQVAVGKDTVAVTQAVVDGKFDLLVKSVRSVSPLGGLFGDIDTRLLHFCPCPVMILKPQRRKAWRSVLVAVDPHA
ncbi:MAG: universal stress protein, partial [Proteobacteria bacterium]|nr:universal stress protein [Pseudomonadota bacterium]